MGAISSLLAFYIASKVKLRGREVLSAILIFTPLSILSFDLWHILSLYLTNVDSGLFFSRSLTGKVLQRAFLRAIGSVGFDWPAAPDAWAVKLTFIFLGMLITTILYTLRDRYPWFRISPEGFWFGVAMGPTWTLSLSMLILKYVATRICGAKFYEEIAQPVAIGIILAFGANVLIQHSLQLSYKWRTAFGINYSP